MVNSSTFPASEEDLVVTFQPLSHVVGVEDGHLCSMKQPFGSHHLNTEHRMKELQRRLTLLLSTCQFILTQGFGGQNMKASHED